MTISNLLHSLHGVRETAPGKYIARCPAHDDRSPSLSIKSCDDGRVLIHCFAGCETEDVLAAVGLTFSDIMPERLPDHHYESSRPYFDARQVLECISHEAMVVALIAEKCASLAGEDDSERLLLAKSRIGQALASAPPLKTPSELKSIRRAA